MVYCMYWLFDICSWWWESSELTEPQGSLSKKEISVTPASVQTGVHPSATTFLSHTRPTVSSWKLILRFLKSILPHLKMLHVSANWPNLMLIQVTCYTVYSSTTFSACNICLKWCIVVLQDCAQYAWAEDWCWSLPCLGEAGPREEGSLKTPLQATLT